MGNMLSGSALARVAGLLKQILDALSGKNWMYWEERIKLLLRGQLDQEADFDLILNRLIPVLDNIRHEIRKELRSDTGGDSAACPCATHDLDAYPKIGMILQKHGVPLEMFVEVANRKLRITPTTSNELFHLCLEEGKLALLKENGDKVHPSICIGQGTFQALLRLAVLCSPDVVLPPAPLPEDAGEGI